MLKSLFKTLLLENQLLSDKEWLKKPVINVKKLRLKKLVVNIIIRSLKSFFNYQITKYLKMYPQNSNGRMIKNDLSRFKIT